MPRFDRIGRLALLLLVMTVADLCLQAQVRASNRKKLLAWADTTTGFQHDSISHAMATIERLGRESGAYDTYIRTDSQWITRQPIAGGARNAHDLGFFDAIFFMGTGDSLNPRQKQELLSWIKEDGKGFVGAHASDAAFPDWPEFAEMLGGLFDNHPWGVFRAPVVVEDPGFPAMRHFPARFTVADEIHLLKKFSRSRVHVLASLDPAKLDYSTPGIHNQDHDFPVAWAKMYGKGRVFYSSFGHNDDVWDNPQIQKMYLEAVEWALRMVGADAGPGAGPATGASGHP